MVTSEEPQCETCGGDGWYEREDKYGREYPVTCSCPAGDERRDEADRSLDGPVVEDA